MKNWMIADDGTAVNLDRVVRVRAESSVVEGAGWLVRAEFDERRWSILANELESRGAALTWIAERFGADPSLKPSNIVPLQRSLRTIMADDSLTDEDRIAEARANPTVNEIEEFANTWRLTDRSSGLTWEIARA